MTVDTRAASLEWFDESAGIVLVKIKDRIVLEEHDAKEILTTSAESFSCENKRALIDLRQIKQMTPEARSYFSDNSGNGTIAVALVISSGIGRVIGNFFIMLNRPKYATRMFNEVVVAEQWLYSN